MIMSWPLLKQIYVVCISYQLCVTYGITMGYSAFLVPQLAEDTYWTNEINENTVQWVGSAGVLLRPIGVLTCALITDWAGRKYTMIIPFLVLPVSWIFIAMSNSITNLIIARLINGLFAGLLNSSLLYISEITAGKYCSMYLSMYLMFSTIGTGGANIVMYYLNWRCSALIFAGYSFVCFVLLFIIPESPHWYVMRNRRIDAEKSLNWFGILSQEQIDRFLEGLQNDTQCNPSAIDKMRCLSQPSNYVNFIIFCALTALARISGYLIINNYTVELFGRVQTIIDSRKLSVIFSWVLFLYGAIFILLTTRVKLRSLNIFCSIGMIFTGVICVVFLIVLKYTVVITSIAHAVQLLLILIVFLYIGFLYIGAGEIIFIIAPQLFPTNIRSILYGALTFFDTLFASVVSFLFPIFIYSDNFVLLFSIFTVNSIFILLLSIRLPKEY